MKSAALAETPMCAAACDIPGLCDLGEHAVRPNSMLKGDWTNAYFLFHIIPMSLFEKEAQHVEGFAKGGHVDASSAGAGWAGGIAAGAVRAVVRRPLNRSAYK